MKDLVITETIINTIVIPNDVLEDCFNNNCSNKEELFDFLNENYYISDFIEDTEITHEMDDIFND